MRLRKNKSKKRMATIVGWHGHSNAGDDGMLYVITILLRRHYSIDTVKVLCGRKDIPRMHIPGVKLSSIYHFGQGKFANRFLNYFLRKIYARRSEVIVFGGGSIFHSENSIRWKKKMLIDAQSSGHCRAALALGISFGPFATPIARKMCEDFVCSLDGVLVRDKESHSLATIAKDERVQLALTHDLALLLPVTSRGTTPVYAEKTLGISINGGQSKEVLSRLLNELTKAIVKLNDENIFKNIRLLAFCSDEHYGDVVILNDLSNILKSNNIKSKIVLYNGSPIEFAEELSQCDVVIGMRLHSQVFAYLTQTAFLPIAYAPKCGGFLESIGYPPTITLDVTSISEKTLMLSLKKILQGDAIPEIRVRGAIATTEQILHTFFTSIIR